MLKFLRQLKAVVQRLFNALLLLFLPSSPFRSHLAWAVFAWVAGRRGRQLSSNSPERDQFRKEAFLQGELDRQDVDSFVESIRDARTTGWSREDFTSGYARDDTIQQIESAYNNHHRHLVLDVDQRQRLASLLTALREPVQRALGCCWRVVNIKIRRTQVTSEDEGPNAWHHDGMPRVLCKVLVYLTPPGPTTGTTELIRQDGSQHIVSGPPGTWLLFENSTIRHRGIPPRERERVVVEVTVAPALKTDVSSVFPGVNTQYPKYPWIRTPKTR